MKDSLLLIINTFKKLWADERGRAVIKLCMYLIFVVFATITATSTLKMNKTNNTKVINVLDKYEAITSYSATYDINSTNYYYSNKDKEIVIIDETSYFVNDNKLISSINGEEYNIDFKFWGLTPQLISQLIEKGEKSYTTTFNDNSTKTSYIVKTEDFIKLFDLNILDIENNTVVKDKNIEIVLTKKDNNISSVFINLSTYYAFINNDVNTYNITITYK